VGELTPERLAEDLIHLPSLPQTTAAIVEVADSPTTSAKDMTRIISTDQALVARVLRIVNSPMYALRQRVTTVTHAVAMLGFDAIKNLALGASMSDVLGQSAHGYGLHGRDLWMHSLTAAVAAKNLAEATGQGLPEESFVAGLVHDMGKLVIHYRVEEAYSRIDKRVEAEGCSWDRAEREELGMDHAQVGEAVALAWRLPDPIPAVARWHHRPMEAEDPVPVCIAHIADTLAFSLGYGSGRDGPTYVCSEAAMHLLRLRQPRIDQIRRKLPEEVSKLTDAVEE
jgi:HD-like signal output (HDOD) protein